jgi:hypothetical protein
MALSNAPTTKPGEQPAAESQDGKNTTTLGTIKVSATTTAATAPSHDLGFYLSQKYSPDRPYYHKYGGAGSGDWAVCKTNKAWGRSGTACPQKGMTIAPGAIRWGAD